MVDLRATKSRVIEPGGSHVIETGGSRVKEPGGSVCLLEILIIF